MPIVAIGSLGGTITMRSSKGATGVTPALDAQDLVDAVPGLEAVADVHTTTLQTLPGASVSFGNLLEALTWARHAVDSGADGVVLVQGTDTLEESAYLLDLFWDRPQPLVLTGAMRAPQQAGADGPANLLAAVQAASTLALGEAGVVVVINDEVHAAARVRKTDATALQAFTSPGAGPIGRVLEGEVRSVGTFFRLPALPQPPPDVDIRVALLESCLDDRGDLIALLIREGYDGVVLGAFGVGHLSAAAADALADAVRQVPVVVASRTGSGSTLAATYGFPGSESDLLRRGAVMAGSLDPRKSRLLLWALLALGRSGEEIRLEFERRGRSTWT